MATLGGAQPAAAATAPESVAAADLTCLALAVYHEARNQPIEGQLAVAHVILNRLEAAPRGATICGIVYKGREFSWTQFEPSRQRPSEQTAWEVAQWVAKRALADRDGDPVGGSTYFHSTAVQPEWAPAMIRVARIGDHIFYVSVPKPQARPLHLIH